MGLCHSVVASNSDVNATIEEMRKIAREKGLALVCTEENQHRKMVVNRSSHIA